MTTNRDLNRAIDEAAEMLREAKASVPALTNNTQEQSQEQLKILELGRLTAAYEANLNTLNNYLPSVMDKDLKLYPSYYSEMEETARREVKEYEDMIIIGDQNASKAGVTKQEMAQFAQDCKAAYLTNCKKRQEALSKIHTIIHNDGMITETDTTTGITKKYDNAWNAID